MKWNPDKKVHELDESVPLVLIQGAMEVLFKAVKLSGALRGEPLPRHEAALIRVHKPYPHHVSGSGIEDGRGESSLEYFQQPVPDFSMGGRGCVLPPRTAPAERPSQSACTEFQQLVLGAQLCNRSNHCYANSVLKCIMWLSADLTEFQAAIGNSIFSDIRPAFQGQPLSLRQLPSWQEATREWAMPHSQHDAGDFLRFLAEHCPGLRFALEMTWEARSFRGDELPCLHIADAILPQSHCT